MMNEFKQTLNKVNSLQQTENGASGYSTSGQNLVDLNFRVPSNHNNVTREDVVAFAAALKEDMVTTIKWLFYLRDVREGLGERDSFVTLFLALIAYNEDTAIKVLPLIPEFGRWKDVVDILSQVGEGTDISNAIYSLIEKQIREDVTNLALGKSVSLLAKWLPSVNASKKSRTLARQIARKLVLTFENYRKMLSALRQYIDVTEVKTCGDKWNEIDYNKVSSNANARYVKAFMKHDPERRKKYLEALLTPMPTLCAVMHATNLYPHEVYAKYNNGSRFCRHTAIADKGIEALWANLKNIPTTGNTMVVCDGSGSMTNTIKGANNIMAIDVSRSLSIFFSERNTGEYKDKVIEFSSTPRYIDLSGCKTLADKYNTMNRFDDCSNTNLQLVFDLLLATAIKNKVPQSDIPQRILIVSDMEFDRACEYTACYNCDHQDIMKKYQTLFETIKQKWTAAGYTMPYIVFWNVNSRTQTLPVSSNEAGVILASGFSVNNVKMVLSGEMNPWTALKSVLDSERYSVIEKALGV